MEDLNQLKNKDHYDNLYTDYNINNILYWLRNLEIFLSSAISTETSWSAIYRQDFQKKIKGKKVLEMGCGDGVNAAIMAGLGAKVYANDISSRSGEIIKKVNAHNLFDYPIIFVEGDFLNNELNSSSFDYIIGKAFLHHLTLSLEKRFLKETARLLKANGEARFFEPAVNNILLDKIRWYIPVAGRPSKFKKKAFIKWKENDPHPDRTFSSIHFEEVGRVFFEDIKIQPLGTIERFSRFFKWGDAKNQFKKWALKNEVKIPYYINRSFARSQLIIYRKPKKI